MEINRGNLDLLHTGFNSAFQEGIAARQASSQWRTICVESRSMTAEESYPWLGALPGMRKWAGERAVHSMELHDWTIKNEDFELTIGVGRNAIEDDRYGVYSQRFNMMGAATEAHPDELVWPLVAAGFDTKCYDGQYFFDGDHPIYAKDGSVGSMSNTGGGAGTAWYLLSLGFPAIRPIVFQTRKDVGSIVMLTDPTDENVFHRKEFLYGVDSRDNAGYAWWQTAYGSKQTLNAANYQSARQAMLGMKGDHGRPIGLLPDTLVVPPTLEGDARRLVEREFTGGGDSNEWYRTAKVVVVPWLG